MLHRTAVLRAALGDRCGVATTAPEDPAPLQVLSGTTRRPNGALHGHAARLSPYETSGDALDLRSGCAL
jgi:acyl-CoA synthetase (AMP-forming)/AMP-acid ligase II